MSEKESPENEASREHAVASAIASAASAIGHGPGGRGRTGGPEWRLVVAVMIGVAPPSGAGLVGASQRGVPHSTPGTCEGDSGCCQHVTLHLRPGLGRAHPGAGAVTAPPGIHPDSSSGRAMLLRFAGQ